MKRNIVITDSHCHVDSMFMKWYLNPPEICIRIRRYTNFYEIIRGLNHEELHCLIQDLFDSTTSEEFDNLIHNDNENSRFREELYELYHKDTKAISKEELIKPSF